MEPPPGNVGYVLQSIDASRGLPVPNLQYWSIAGGVDSNVVFNGAGGGQVETIIITIAGNDANNQLLAYNTADLTQTVSIFNPGGVKPTTPVTVTVNIPYLQYGFELKNTQSGVDFFSGTDPQFAFFRSENLAGTWWVGCEDLKGGDQDYNDLVFKVSTVPLPPSALLLGSGLLGLLALRRRRRDH